MSDQPTKVIFPATVSKVTTMSDGSIRIHLDTQEISDPVKKAGLFSLWGVYGNCMLSVEDIEEETLEPLPAAPSNPNKKKSPSQRLRGVFYHLWLAKGEPMASFEEYYATMMERIIGHYRNEIDKA